MRYLSKDWWIPALLILNIMVFSGLFYYDLNKKINFGSREIIGTIIFKNNTVHRKFHSEVVWQNIESNSPIANRDTIRSFHGSDALVNLESGARVVMDEDSMIYLDISNKEQKIDFRGGSISVDASKGGNQKMSVHSGNYKINISDQSHIKLEQFDDDKFSLFVKDGDVDVFIGDKKKRVGKDQKLEISSKGVSVSNIPVKLISPPNQKQYSTSSTISPVFVWEKKEDVENSFIEISKTSRFSRFVFRKSTEKNSEQANLSKGVYYWRVGIVSNGKRKYSETRKIFIFDTLVPKTYSPKDKSVFTYFASPPIINFFWSKNTYSNRYRLEVSTSPDFNNPLEYKLNSNHLTLSNLIEGKYYWRVLTDVSLNTKNQLVTPTYSFVVKQKRTVHPPKTLNPLDNEFIVLKKGKKTRILLNWKASHEQKVFKVEVSRGGNFMNPIVDKKVSSLSLWLTEIQKEGTWYWRVMGYTSDGFESGYSKIVKFHTSYDPFKKLEDIIKDTTKEDEKTTRESQEIQDTKREVKETAREVRETAKEIKKLKKQFQEKPKKTQAKKKQLKPKKKKKEIVQKTNVHARLEAPAKLYPVGKNNKVNPTDGKPIHFKWKKVPKATNYEFNLYKDKRRGGDLIFKDKTKKNSYRFNQFEKLDKGKFEWEVNALDNNNRPGKKIRGKFQIEIPNDPLDDLRPEDIEITSPKVIYRE